MPKRLQEELPLGFSMALAMNLDAMHTFASMSRERQHTVIEAARRVSSKEEMQALVNNLVKQ